MSATTHFTDFINELLKAPEMPETQAFVPTQMSGLEAANPLAGYTTIAPPEANNMGTANLTYPIQVPAGRGGMQPNVALNYNSNGGNGICGMGWDLPIPCISVETRWGVPLYDSQNETETYLFNGEQLLVSYEAMPTFVQAPVRRTSDYTKRFYPRVEGAFDSILRHGTSPQTYWWEVFDRQGTCYIYGQGDGELKAYGSQAVAKWYLTRVIDRNGNTMRYQYKKYEEAAGDVTSGTALFLDKIIYTSPNNGFSPQPWYGYCVQFDYGFRNDPVISGNYGLKENMCKRLEAIKTWFVKIEPTTAVGAISASNLDSIQKFVSGENGGLECLAARTLNWDTYIQTDSSLIRGYRLLYNYSLTGKSLLTAVVEMSAHEWNEHGQDVSVEDLTSQSTYKYHRFKYQGIKESTFGNGNIIQTKVDDASSGLKEFYASPLGGSKEWKSGFGFNVAFGLDFNAWLRSINLEITGGVTPESTSQGTTALVDLNGDGFPDILYRGSSGDWMCQLYIPDTTSSLCTGRYGDPILADVPSDEFSASITKDDYSVGLGAHAGVEQYETSVGLNLGGQGSTNSSDITAYFADVNADGKVDIVNDGRVYFNNTYGDNVKFGRTLDIQPIPAAICDTGYYSLSGASPLNDSIFDNGHISYTTVFGGNEKIEENVIQDTLVERRTDIDTTYRSTVRAWIAQYDGNIHITGDARLDTNFMEAISRTDADGVHISILHNGSIIAGTSHDLDLNTPSHNYTVGTTVQKGDRIYFRVEALKNDHFDVVEWNPVIYYTDSDKDTAALDDSRRKKYVFSAKDDFLAWQGDRFYMPMSGTVKVEANYSMLREQVDTVNLRIIHMKSGETYADTTMTIPAGTTVNPEDGIWSFVWSMDSSDALIFEVDNRRELDWPALNWHPHVVSDSFVDTTIPNYVIMNNKQGEEDTIYTIDIYPSPIYPCNDFTEWNNTTLDTILGVFHSTYRGWGAFTYNCDTMRTPMDESLIRPSSKYNNFDGMDSIGLEGGLVNALGGDTNQRFSYDAIQSGLASFIPNNVGDGTGEMSTTYDDYNENRIWSATGYRSYVSATHIGLYNWQSVRAALNDSVLLVPVTNRSVAAESRNNPGMAVGPVKGSKQFGYGVHVSLGAGVQEDEGSNNLNINGCVNYSHGESWVTADFIDMNGDNYPDVVGRNEVQYTNSRGGLSNKRAGTAVDGDGIQYTIYDAGSLQGGSSFATYEKQGKGRGQVHIEQRSKGGSQSRTLAMSLDRQSISWMDMNGDGLPDRISGGMVCLVYLNLGYSYFSGKSMNGIQVTRNASTTSSTSGDLANSTNIPADNNYFSGINKSFSGGKSISQSDNVSSVMYVDINGDGLADKLVDDNTVYFNNGWGFNSNGYRLNNNASSHGGGYNVDYHGNGTYGLSFTIFGLSFKFQGSLGGTVGNSISTTESTLMDMNSDGLPDVVCRSNSTDIVVFYNQLYDVDKLVTVESFYGNRMELTYAQAKYSSRSRQRPTVMASLNIIDSTNSSNDRRYYTFDYVGYVHSATERTAFGFDSVIVKQYMGDRVYRITRQHYRNDLYKMRGKKTSELVTDAQNKPYIKQVWNYELKQIVDGFVVRPDVAGCFGATWPALDSVATIYYNDTVVKIETAERYIHLDSGRVVGYVNWGNIATPSDDVHCSVSYTRGPRNQYALADTMIVMDGSGNVKRKRTAKYDIHGRLAELILYSDTSNASTVSNYTYDEYGNPHSVILPPNNSNQRAIYVYTYDTMLHQFRIQAKDSIFNMISRTEYDVRLGVPLRIYSIGGDSISYSYDDWGRPLTVRAPQENDTNGYPTISYIYWDNAQPAVQVNTPNFQTFTSSPAVSGRLPNSGCNNYSGWPIWAQTLHRSQMDTGLDVTTVLFADGHGRVLQTRKSAVVDGRDVQVASAPVIYDDAGRPSTTYEPFEVSGVSFCEYVSFESSHGDLYTQTKYDVLDRVVATDILPMNITTTIDYDFDEVDDITHFSKTVTNVPNVTNPERQQTIILTDARGLTAKTIDAEGGETGFEYDALGQLIHSSDPDEYVTSYEYDMLGHVIKRKHPDAGSSQYKYDPAGNLVQEKHFLDEINYDYTYYRLTRKRYSLVVQNNVTYTYGSFGRDAGQIIRVVDGSGVQELEYDEMGRVAKSVRRLTIPGSGYSYTFTHTFAYDSWNRMHQMTYPDGETIYYNYNRSGDLVSMNGSKGNSTCWYIKNILYNKDGQRSSIYYGNGTHTEYSYDKLHRLSGLYSQDVLGIPMQKIDYFFDNVNNITKVHNSAPTIPGIDLGGEYTNNYRYDRLNRLTYADGDGTVGWRTRSFVLDGMEYSASGRLGNKTQSWYSPTNTGNQSLHYYYDRQNAHAHQPGFISDNASGCDYQLTWSATGNLIRKTVMVDNVPTSTRFLSWTEDNRLCTVVDERNFCYFVYDHTGERMLKMSGEISDVDQNAKRNHLFATLDHVTMYPSPYLVFTERGYTKHYYAGSERVAARIGGGGLGCGDQCVIPDELSAQNARDLFSRTVKHANERKIDPPVKPKYYDINNKELENIDKYNFEKIPDCYEAEVKPYVVRFHDKLEHLSNPIYPIKPAYDNEPEVYFYHSDHLGGANWITDGGGKPVQHLQYLPFGEPFVNQHIAGYQERYTFTGKERDEETGYGYFGARYMDHELMTMWLSVDPLADKYPGISPYAYCAWNPVKLVDPDGREIFYKEGKNHFVYKKNAEGKYGFYNCRTGEAYSGDNQKYVDDLTKALGQLKEGEHGNKLVSYFEGHQDRHVFIQEGQENNQNGASIRWNNTEEDEMPVGTSLKDPVQIEPAATFVSLGHEMAHTRDAYKFGDKFKKMTKKEKEQRAMLTENFIRKEHGLRQRTFYALKDEGSSVNYNSYPALVIPTLPVNLRQRNN
ncbi:MAG: hypothetical protein K5842_02150 [Bacteroidales bacterium]|nr:hypothetical protein [Bacteroidales bacterium]